MDLLRQQLRHYNPAFTDAELHEGLQRFEQHHAEAGAMLSDRKQPERRLFYLESSVCRCTYPDKEGTEQTLWMKPAQTFLADYKGFVEGGKTPFSLQAYEAGMVHSIHRDAFQDLCRAHTNWALFGLHMTEALHVGLIDVFTNLLSNDATDNYRYIEFAFPEFLRVAPLKHIASMLQVSSVTLSRIRSGKQRKS